MHKSKPLEQCCYLVLVLARQNSFYLYELKGMALIATDIDKLVGHRIQRRRKELKVTAETLSEVIDVSQPQLSRYERGVNKINVGLLVEIAAYLDTPITWFLSEHEEGDKPQSESHFMKLKQDELKEQLDFIWPKMTFEQQHAFIVLLDKFLK